MALRDESWGPFLAVLAGAARRGARGVGALAGPHGRTEGGDATGTKWQCWQAAVLQQAKGVAAVSLGRKRTAEKGSPALVLAPAAPPWGLTH